MKSKITLAMALLVTLVGLYGVATQLTHKEQPPTTASQTVDRNIQVAMLTQAVKRGERVSYDVLQKKQIKESEARALGLSASNEFSNFAHGAVFKNDLSENQYIRATDMIDPSSEGYYEYIAAENMVPYFLTLDSSAIGGGVVIPDSAVDILAISGLNSNKKIYNSGNKAMSTVAIKPILTGVKVLQLIRDKEDKDSTEVTLVLELSRKGVATLMVAKNIAVLEVQKSTGQYDVDELQADAGDIFKDFNAIREYRGNDVQIN
ncbi:Flp pilus assembly protein CpaB [Vibrio owensii]|uniref:Flp pilus assembly protein CpaB n=1 Tax=Vibrio owensii TaxID=696485 RepID=UPI003AAEBA70